MRKNLEQAAGRDDGRWWGLAGMLGLGRVGGGLLLLAMLYNPVPVQGAALASPGVVALAWNPNPEADVTSYELSYGTVSGVHPNIVEAGLGTTASVTGLVEGTTYYFVVSACNQAGLRSDVSAEISYQVPVTPVDPVSVIDRSGWSLLWVDSQETKGYPATAAFDGSSSSFWHTAFRAGTTPPPHEIQIDLGVDYPVGGFRYLPRQDAYTVGNIATYEFYVSGDGLQWGAPVATGTFANSKVEKEVLFATVSGRYVRLRSLAEVSGGDECNVAELKVLRREISLPPQTAPSFADWAAAANLSVLAKEPLATPYQDGIANLLKYAFCMNGKGPDVRVLGRGTGTEGLPFIAFDRSGGTAVLRFEYLRRKNSTLLYTPRKSLDMKTWRPLSSSTPLSVTDLDSEWERVVFAEPCDAATPILFGRVEVLMPTL